MSLIYKGQTIAGAGGSGGSSEEIYSTEETRIGTWIDGKPIYKISLIRDSFTITGGTRSDVGFSDESIIDTLVDGAATFKNETTQRIGEIYVAITNNKLAVNMVNVGTITGRLVITIRYTKTTDYGGIYEN